jgi:probable phosphoglycerate mutase
MTTIYLIRHSESLKSNNKSINEEIPLSDRGAEIAKNLSDLNEFKNIDLIYSSEYKRAISTAKYIAFNNNLPINITSKLNERKLGDINSVPKTFWLTQLEDENAKTNGGESRKEVCERMLLLIEELLNDNKTKKIVLVTHATAITFLLMYWCKLVGADLETKARHLTFNNKDVINDSFRSPEVFKLEFDENNNLMDIILIRGY